MMEKLGCERCPQILLVSVLTRAGVDGVVNLIYSSNILVLAADQHTVTS